MSTFRLASGRWPDSLGPHSNLIDASGLKLLSRKRASFAIRGSLVICVASSIETRPQKLMDSPMRPIVLE